MGSSQSARVPSEDDHLEAEDDEEGEEEEEVEEDGDDIVEARHNIDATDHARVKKILQQEPEMLPCHASASPLSPQLSTYSTPRMGPSIKVWDPYNVLAPPPHFHRSLSASSAPAAAPAPAPGDDDTEVYLISHGECHMNLRPDLIGGRCHDAALTPNGKRQARALAVFLKSQGVRFNAVYTSPLDRVRATAQAVCQELNFSEEHIQSADALVEMSQGHWEGCHRSEILTPDMMCLMENFQPDFSAPSGESLREVEFRMVQFLHGTVMAFPHKLRSDFSPPDPSDNPAVFPNRTSHGLDNLIHDQDGIPSHWELLQQHRNRQGQGQGQGLLRKKSGKSRLQIVTSTGDHEAADDGMSPRLHNNPGELVGSISLHMRSMSSSSSSSSSCVGVFTHTTPIKCLVTGLLGCSPAMSQKICIEDSSVTVLQHSWKVGWQIKRLNDTSHLRLL
ncbi:uncharacterized protein LOC127258224 [Andrographis paniculata]|uniref:uncharacterized protein LOC127258224 n=1 Tax=Andrographis paniculata TaxID=175694 RepID=UPI0021E79831|nr:uncharacterized protein LOC127258224 [Andrographis paniculata]